MRQSEKSDAYYAVSHVDTFALEEKLEHSQASQPRVRSTRKQILLILCVCGCTLLAWLFALLSITSTSKFSPSCVSDLLSPNSRETSIARRVDKILKSAPLIDGHNDLAILIRALYKNQIYSENFTQSFEHGPMLGHVDIPRLRAGKNGGAFWSAFMPCPANWSDFSTKNYAESVTSTLSQIDLLNRLQSAYPNIFSPSTLTSSSALSTFHKHHTLISPIGIEGLHQIGNSLSTLRLYHSLGVKYSTLTHNCHNIYADSALSEIYNAHHAIEVAEPYWGGLSPAGFELVKEMNRIGMIVDLAHTSVDTMRDVLSSKGSQAPTIFSHSSAYALCPHPRNVPDSILSLVKKSNSVVMVNFSPSFISCVTNATNPHGLPIDFPQNATLNQVARHITYIGDKIGYDHVGLGSDFDGIESTPRGFEDVSKFPVLVAELLRKGVSDHDVKKIVGGNVLRVWRDVEKVAKKLQKSGMRPIEDAVGELVV